MAVKRNSGILFFRTNGTENDLHFGGRHDLLQRRHAGYPRYGGTEPVQFSPGLGSAARGYSLIWLVVLYLMGAILRKCEIGRRITPARALPGALLCLLPAWLWMILGREFLFLNIRLNPTFALQYNSPFVLGAALFTLLGLIRLPVPARWRRPISFLASGAFAAYLINCHLFVWEYFMYGLLRPLARLPLPLMLLGVLGFALLFLLGSVLVDHGRQLLFRLLRVRSRAQALADKLAALLPASLRGQDD